ncbi:Fic family protein [Legionella erythra]|uniref:Ankyrin repeat-containing protein n=1 Tax=Legionella erythra TaxID=448 RepID=A0A0W0TFV6_LEGER|nr:Fic family protein [Legionella erythra]KTC94471.1 ankyrin repeat-containing protein [Legionella erythra]
MKIRLYFGTSNKDIDINQKSSPSEQVKKALEENNIHPSDLKQIRFENHVLEDIDALDSWYRHMEELAAYNQTRNKRLLPHENVNITPTSRHEVLENFKKNYPKNRLWQLAVDGQLYSSMTGHSLVKADPEPGWVRYCERETNSLDAFFATLNVSLDNIEDLTLSEELILALHEGVTRDVHLGMNQRIQRGAYRDSSPHFSFSPKHGRITPTGLADLLNKIENNELNSPDEEDGYGILLWPKFHDGSRFFITPEKIKEERTKYVGDGDNLAFAEFLIDQCVEIYYQAPANPEALVQETIAHYNETIGTLSDPDDILELIGKTTEAFERIHPFGDANGRTFVNLLQNRLLIQNGFPPATLFEPNLYDVYGHHVDVLKRGILNTLAIYNGENVFGYPMHKHHPLYPEHPDPIHSNSFLLNSQAYFDWNENLKSFSMQYHYNPLFEFFESGHFSSKTIQDAIAHVQNPLDKLDYVSEAIKHQAQNGKAMILLDQVFNEIVSSIPAPNYTQTPEDFEAQELYYQAQLRLRAHQQNEAVVKLSLPAEQDVNPSGKDEAGKTDEKEKEKEKELQPEGLRQRPPGTKTIKDKIPEVKPDTKEQALLEVLHHYITMRQVEADSEKKSKHYKTRVIGIKLGHSAKDKIRAAKKLMALVQNKPFRGERIQSLDATDYSALTHSRLGQLMQPYMDIIQRYHKTGLEFNQASGG